MPAKSKRQIAGAAGGRPEKAKMNKMDEKGEPIDELARAPLIPATLARARAPQHRTRPCIRPYAPAWLRLG